LQLSIVLKTECIKPIALKIGYFYCGIMYCKLLYCNTL